MKNGTLLPWLLGCALFLVGCGKGSPDENARQFFNALQRNDFDGATQYATKSSVSVINSLKNMRTLEEMGKKWGLGKKPTEPQLPQEAKTVQCEPETTENKTFCVVCCTADNKSKRYEMVYEDGKWLVHFKLMDGLY